MTTVTAVNDAITYLEAHGFHRDHRRNCYDHASGDARVELLDDEAACFAVYAFTHDRIRLLTWKAELHGAPLPVFTATVAAAIA